MNSFLKSAMLALLVALQAVVLPACKEVARTSPSASPTAPANSSTLKKSGAPIAFSHTYDGNSTALQVENFELLFQPTQPIDTLTIELHSPQDILVDGDRTLPPAVAGNSVVRIPVSIQALTDGKFYLNALVQTERNGQRLGRAFAIAIRVGEQRQSQKKATENTEKVHILPAREDLR